MRPSAWQLLGVGLFLFIPLVLYLFVRHPAPIGASVGAGLALMVGHRFLARPYMEATRTRKCLWCNRWLGVAESSVEVPVISGTARLVFVTCERHERPAHRFLAWVERLRLPLRLGIGLPLAALLVTLLVAALCRPAPTELAADLFRFVVGLTVNLAALGPLLGPSHGRDDSPLRAAFPPHNFSLLGVRAILWIFRIVGVYWLWTAGSSLVERFVA